MLSKTSPICSKTTSFVMSSVFFHLLHFFIGKIDDELFEAVTLGCAGLEAVHVEDAHWAMLARGLDLKWNEILKLHVFCYQPMYFSRKPQFDFFRRIKVLVGSRHFFIFIAKIFFKASINIRRPLPNSFYFLEDLYFWPL